MIAKKNALDSGSDYTMQVDLSEDERLAHLNLSASVLCVTVFNDNNTERSIYEDICIAGRRIITASCI